MPTPYASALEIALRDRNQALVQLLPCNGYDPNLELESPLNLPLRNRRWDLLDLVLEWGADPRRVGLSDLFDTYNSELYERFRNLGVNLTANHELPETLAYHNSNKPLFGYARRNRESDPRRQEEYRPSPAELAVSPVLAIVGPARRSLASLKGSLYFFVSVRDPGATSSPKISSTRSDHRRAPCTYHNANKRYLPLYFMLFGPWREGWNLSPRRIEGLVEFFAPVSVSRCSGSARRTI